MGVISQVLGGRGITAAAEAVTDVAEVFRPNATRQMELGHEAYRSALSQHSAEFAYGRLGLFDRLMNGLNRLPRPFLALGTLGLFVYAMVDPAAFSQRMQGLGFVPDPLWWLLGAIVSFYFGAREMHYLRDGTQPYRSRRNRRRATGLQAQSGTSGGRRIERPGKPSTNPALEAWRARRGG